MYKLEFFSQGLPKARMKQKINISLKLKILLVLIGLLTVSTGFNIYYSYQTFVNDKTAYLFDSILKKSEALTDQINQEVTSFEVFSDLYFKDQDKSTFNFDKIQSFLITFNYDASNNLVETLISNSKSAQFSNESIDALIQKIKSDNGKSLQRSLNAPMPLHLKNNLIFVKSRKFSDSQRYSIIAFSGSKIKTLIEKDSQTKNSLTWNDKNNQLTIGNQIADEASLREFITSKIYKVSKEIQNGENEYLVALNKSTTLPFTVVSAVDKKIAFEITSSLIIKTVLFALFLLGLFFAVGIIFSSQITTPIRELTRAANQVAEGVYEYKENINSNDELKLLGITFEKMSSEIKSLLVAKEDMIQKLADANEKLDEYNKNLEEMVKERTRQLNEANTFMSAMINSLDQGLVVFDQALNIKPIYTRASVDLFQKSPENITYAELIGKTDETSLATLTQWAQITFNKLLPFESAVGLAPDHVKFGDNVENPDFKYISLSYYPMINENEDIDNIVTVATDKTSQLISEHQFKKQEAYVQMILKILKSKNSFHSFIEEVNKIFENFNNCFTPGSNKVDIDLAMMLFHTLNGGFGLYRLFDLQIEARSNEQYIIDSKPNLPGILDEFNSALRERIKKLNHNFSQKLLELDKTLGSNFATGDNKKEISMDKIKAYFNDLQLLVKQSSNHERLVALQKQYEDAFLKITFKEYFTTYEDLCAKTMEKLGKELAPFNYTNEDTLLNPDHYQEFFNVLIHLFRNIMDHAIEQPHRREELGKGYQGHIGLSIETIMNESFVITIEDDGAGIDPARIRKKLAELQPDKDYSNVSDKEVIYRIFDPFFSTRDEVSELSGRGVGMSAIQEVVERMKGSIEIESHVNKGTRFVFNLPQL